MCESRQGPHSAYQRMRCASCPPAPRARRRATPLQPLGKRSQLTRSMWGAMPSVRSIASSPGASKLAASSSSPSSTTESVTPRPRMNAAHSATCAAPAGPAGCSLEPGMLQPWTTASLALAGAKLKGAPPLGPGAAASGVAAAALARAAFRSAPVCRPAARSGGSGRAQGLPPHSLHCACAFRLFSMSLIAKL
ncbi:MAG: hypothetical protein J3K34DRAFT_431387 [Monoraphidium minutum]|nr:MAG: hypothetical protein J3K34DRAFT_431387 [Monoraphidium minutum]